MSKLEEANEIIRDLAEEIKKDDGIIEQLRADLDHWKSVVEGVNKTLGATTTTDALMKLAQLRAALKELAEIEAKAKDRIDGFEWAGHRLIFWLTKYQELLNENA